MACIPCLVSPIMIGSSFFAFLNRNKMVVFICFIIITICMYYYQKHKNCKECKKK